MLPKPENPSCTKSLVDRIVNTQNLFEKYGASPNSDNSRAELINSVLAIQGRYSEQSGLFNCVVSGCSKAEFCPQSFEISPPNYKTD